MPGTYGIACDRIASLPADIDLAFTSQNGTAFNLTIPSSELSVGPFSGNSSICQTLINALELDLEEGEIVGGSLMKHYYTIFDIGAQRIGFAPSANVSSTGNTTNTDGGSSNSGNNTGGSSNKPSSAPAKPLGANFASVAVLMGLALSLAKVCVCALHCIGFKLTVVSNSAIRSRNLFDILGSSVHCVVANVWMWIVKLVLMQKTLCFDSIYILYFRQVSDT